MTHSPTSCAIPNCPYGCDSKEIVFRTAREIEQERLARKRMRGWSDMDAAPKDGTRFLAVVSGQVRTVSWGRASHIAWWGWCLVDQGAEDRDICEPTLWQPMPALPATRDMEASNG